MMNSLDEAIKHCEEVAERLENSCKRDWMGEDDESCASEHRQLAEWLKKLQAYEEAREEIIRKRDSGQWSEAVVFGFNHAIYIIDKHLREVNTDDTNGCEN